MKALILVPVMALVVTVVAGYHMAYAQSATPSPSASPRASASPSPSPTTPAGAPQTGFGSVGR
jgi:hypothetical protein